MSYRSTLRGVVMQIIVLTMSVPTLGAQVPRRMPGNAAVRPLMKPTKAIRPRVYTSAQFLTRLRALSNGAAILAQLEPSNASTPQGGAGSGGAVQLRDLPTGAGTGSSLGTVGGSVSLSFEHPTWDHAGWGAALDAQQVEFGWGDIWFSNGSYMWLSLSFPPSSTPQTYALLFDISPINLGYPPSSISIYDQRSPRTLISRCTAAQMLASQNEGVLTCAATITNAMTAIVISDEGGTMDGLVDVSLMRIR